MARKPGELLLEILEAEIDAERLCVLQEKFPSLRDLRGRLCLNQAKTGNCPCYPISIPPLTLNT